VQRFGSALQLTPHFHTVVVDGVFLQPGPAGRGRFVRLPPPSDEEVEQIATQVATRVERLLAPVAKSDAPDDPHARTLALALRPPPDAQRGARPIHLPEPPRGPRGCAGSPRTPTARFTRTTAPGSSAWFVTGCARRAFWMTGSPPPAQDSGLNFLSLSWIVDGYMELFEGFADNWGPDLV
jgi:putative transposase